MVNRQQRRHGDGSSDLADEISALCFLGARPPSADYCLWRHPGHHFEVRPVAFHHEAKESNALCTSRHGGRPFLVSTYIARQRGVVGGANSIASTAAAAVVNINVS